MCESCQATHPSQTAYMNSLVGSMSRRHIGVSRSSKVFTITADTSNGLVTFGMLGRKVWVMVVRNDGTSLNSLDTPQANRIASYWLPKSLWPAFASHLHPDSPDAVQKQLF